MGIIFGHKKASTGKEVPVEAEERHLSRTRLVIVHCGTCLLYGTLSFYREALSPCLAPARGN